MGGGIIDCACSHFSVNYETSLRSLALVRAAHVRFHARNNVYSPGFQLSRVPFKEKEKERGCVCVFVCV